MKNVLVILFFLCTLSLCEAADNIHFQWKKASVRLPHPVSNAAVLPGQDRIYVLGGNDEKGATKCFYSFEPETGLCTRLPDMPAARFGHCAALYGSSILVFGGMQKDGDKTVYLKSVEAYDLTTGVWKKAGDMPGQLGRAAVVAVKDRLVIIGGEDQDHKALSQVYSYDPARGTWERRKDLPRPRNRHSAVVMKGEILVIGGEDEKGSVLSSMAGCSINKDCWAERPSLLKSRRNFSAAVLGNTVVVSGGWEWLEGKRIFLAETELYDGKAWQQGGALMAARDGARAIPFHGALYLFGGYNGKLLASVERGAFVSHESPWRVDQELKIHLAYFRDDEKELTDSNSVQSRPMTWNPSFEPDITNIKLKGIRDLGFPLPGRDRIDDYSFFLKFYEYPSSLNCRRSARLVFDPLLIFDTGEGTMIDQYIRSREHVLVKKGFIAPTKMKFTESKPYPPLRSLREPLALEGREIAPQSYFDGNIPFSSIYLLPYPASQGGGDEASRARKSAAGVLALHGELLSLYGKSFRPLPARGGGREGFDFIDDSALPYGVAASPYVTIYHLPSMPMVFTSYRQNVMPSDPAHIFLTGLLLVHQYVYELPRDASSSITAIQSLKGKARLVRTHVFEGGSVIRE